MSEPEYTPPSPLAERIREEMREKHANCGAGGDSIYRSCALGRLWAEDIQEILDAAGRDTSCSP